MAIAPTYLLNVKLSSGSFRFVIWAPAPAPGKMPSSGFWLRSPVLNKPQIFV